LSGRLRKEGEEPAHVAEGVLNETCEERFLLTPRNPEELEEVDSSLGDDTVEDNTGVKSSRP